ncbi:MAG TPA: hypothetical protein VML75_13705 [Kofleriaceae bacterium]|nr:hypothetical protein [Kofleriaceae bacterium]
MPIQGRQAVSHYQQRRQQATELAHSYEGLRQHIDARRTEIREQGKAARLELARVYLTELSPEAFERAARLTGFQGFQRRDPIKAMEHERVVLEKTIARIGADERYQQRELLAGPDGTLTTKLAEVHEMLEPWVAECQKFEQHDGFAELVFIGYDTPRFEGKWWQSTYWKHWAAGDRICQALGMDDFGDDVLPAYTRCSEQRAFWQGEERGLQAKLKEIHDLTWEHDVAVARIPDLPTLYLEQSQEFLGEYLGDADVGLLEEWAAQAGEDHRGITMALRKVAGLKAKDTLLHELQEEGIAALAAELRGRAGKYQRKIAKFSRPKNSWMTFNDNVLDHGFETKHAKLRERHAKLQMLVDRVYTYDDYHHFRLDNDPALWWLEMTHKQPPAMMVRTRKWYERNRDAAITHERWDEADGADPMTQAVAVAAAARELDEVGYLS